MDFRNPFEAIPEDREIIDEVDEGDVGAVEDRRSIVKLPSDVWVGDVVEVKAVTAAYRWIDGLRVGVSGLQGQIVSDPAHAARPEASCNASSLHSGPI